MGVLAGATTVSTSRVLAGVKEPDEGARIGQTMERRVRTLVEIDSEKRKAVEAPEGDPGAGGIEGDKRAGKDAKTGGGVGSVETAAESETGREGRLVAAYEEGDQRVEGGRDVIFHLLLRTM